MAGQAESAEFFFHPIPLAAGLDKRAHPFGTFLMVVVVLAREKSFIRVFL
jgi:hypothetical protein